MTSWVLVMYICPFFSLTRCQYGVIWWNNISIFWVGLWSLCLSLVLSTICMVWPPDWKEKYIIQSLMYFEYMKLTIRLLLSGLSIGFNDSVTYYHNFLKINLIILINCKKKPFKNTQLRYVSRKGFLVVNNSSKHWRTFCFNFAILLTTSYQKQKLH